MTRSLGEALSLLADKGDINLENSIFGIEKESLRVSKKKPFQIMTTLPH